MCGVTCSTSNLCPVLFGEVAGGWASRSQPVTSQKGKADSYVPGLSWQVSLQLSSQAFHLNLFIHTHTRIYTYAYIYTSQSKTHLNVNIYGSIDNENVSSDTNSPRKCLQDRERQIVEGCGT